MMVQVLWSRSIAIVAACGMLAPTARAQDGGGLPDSSVPSDGTVPLDAGAGDGAIGCDTISSLGACQRTVNLYCDYSSNTVVRYDCAQLTRDGGLAVGCGVIDCADADCYGYACRSPSGGFCDGQQVYCDEGQGMGCTAIPWVGAAGGTCQAAAACDPSTFVADCDGDLLTWCPLTRVWSFSCSGGGVQPYICGDGTSGKACLGTAGGACNLVAVPPYECAPGYKCNSQDGSGLCVPSSDGGTAFDGSTPGDAAPTVNDVAGGGASSSNGACGCDGTPAGDSKFWVLAAILAACLVRRRW